jgi:hypothetical protein
MDDFLPMILTFLAIVLVLFFGLSIYSLSLFVPFYSALSISASGLSLIVCPILLWLIPNIDYKDAIIAIRGIGVIVLIASLVVFSFSLVKAFAISW